MDLAHKIRGLVVLGGMHGVREWLENHGEGGMEKGMHPTFCAPLQLPVHVLADVIRTRP